MNSTEANVAFNNLKPLVEHRLFRTKYRGPRHLTVSEFMYMGHRNGHDQFKHVVTRNYIFVRKIDNKLIVPLTNEPFMLGFFDMA